MQSPADAQIPMAVARAFDKGHLGLMDYYRIRNMQTDTTMRESIGSNGAETSSAGAHAAKS